MHSKILHSPMLVLFLLVPASTALPLSDGISPMENDFKGGHDTVIGCRTLTINTKREAGTKGAWDPNSFETYKRNADATDPWDPAAISNNIVERKPDLSGA